jgi:hypothetical protein
VIKLSGGINLTNSSNPITISGDASSYFIFQVASQFVSNSGTETILTGGIDPNHILWLYSGTSALALTGGNTSNNEWDGTVISPHADIQIHDRAFNGEYIGGQNIAITSNPLVNDVSFAAPIVTPEPETFSLIAGAGLIALGAVCRNRRKA